MQTVSPDDIATSLGRESLTGVERAQIQAWIEEAIFLVLRRVNFAEVDPDAYTYVIRQAVIAVAERPTPGVVQESVQVDDGMVSTRYSKASRRIEILPEWWEMLGVTTGKTGAAFSVDMSGGLNYLHAATCALNLGAAYCDCGADIAGFPIFGGN